MANSNIVELCYLSVVLIVIGPMREQDNLCSFVFSLHLGIDWANFSLDGNFIITVGL